MRLRQIEVFHAVYANGSVSAAARALGVSQPSVSKVLRHTETQLGYRLFSLVKGRLVPTDEAHALFREVRDVFDRITSLQQAAENLRHGGGGHLRVGVVPSLGLDALPAAIARFRQRYPQVTFSVQTLHHGETLRALYERQCDVFIGFSPPEHPRLTRRTLATGQLAVVAPPGTFAHGEQGVTIARLSEHPAISVVASGPLGNVVREALADQGVVLNEIASVGTYFIAGGLVRHGCGIAVLDPFTAAALTHPALEVFPLLPALQVDVQAIWLDDRPPSLSCERFLATFGEVCRAVTGEA